MPTCLLYFATFALAIVCLGCARTHDEPNYRKTLHPAFYYWRSVFKLDSVERRALKDTKCEKIYLKCFDVTWDEALHTASPVAEIRWHDSIPAGIALVPVIFLTEPSLARTPPAAIAKLAHDCIAELRALLPGPMPKEIQFDCDWSDRARINYFAFLHGCRSELPRGTILSATVRLHQIKYHQRTGVPPIDRGMLMDYNMSDWRSASTRNSIFDADVAQRYIDSIRGYPLALDLALPIFHWTIVYRNEHFSGILYNHGATDFEHNTAFMHQAGTNFVVRRDTVVGQLLLRHGDLLRTECVPIDVLRDAEQRALHRFPEPELTLALFSLDAIAIRQYETSSLDSLWSVAP